MTKHLKTIRPVSRLEMARRDRGLRQQDLAVLAGLSRATIAVAERGYEPTPATATAIADALGVSATRIWPGFKSPCSHGRES